MALVRCDMCALRRCYENDFYQRRCLCIHRVS